MSIIVVLGASFGPSWGLTFGRVSAFIFLADMFLHVFTDLPEIYSETQTAIAGWRKVLTVLDLPVEIVEPVPAWSSRRGPLSVTAYGVDYSYREGGPVLHGITLEVEAGEHVAIVGETGCGKTTFVKLVSRLADPADGPDRGRWDRPARDLGAVSPAFAADGASGRIPVRHDRARERSGRPDGASDRDVKTAFEELGLGDWVAALPRASTRWSASGERRCPSASASWCRSPAHTSPSRAC